MRNLYSFTHFSTLPEEILPARQGLRLLSSTCHIGWASPTSQDVAQWQLPMSAKMKPREGKKTDGSKFHTPECIKVTPVSIASKRRNGNCSFLQQSCCERWGVFLGQQGGRAVNSDGRIVTMSSTFKPENSYLKSQNKAVIDGRFKEKLWRQRRV